jgi:hypothetical protein
MNNLEEQQGIIDALFSELDALSPPDLGKRISRFVDEQPHLMGFMFNLDDDFSEESHNYLLKSAIVIRDVLVGAGIPLKVVDNQVIEQIVDDRVDRYDSLSGIEAKVEDYMTLSSSPQMLEAVVKHAKSNDENLILIIDVIISVLEESAADQKERSK